MQMSTYSYLYEEIPLGQPLPVDEDVTFHVRDTYRYCLDIVDILRVAFVAVIGLGTSSFDHTVISSVPDLSDVMSWK